jgi:hypothetical protein
MFVNDDESVLVMLGDDEKCQDSMLFFAFMGEGIFTTKAILFYKEKERYKNIYSKNKRK